MSSYKAQLNAALKQKGLNAAPSIPTSSSFGSTGGGVDGASILKVGGPLLIVILIVLLVLAVVHYTIRPIFKLKPSDKGFIPLPGISEADDSEIYWETITHGDLNENDTILESSKGSAAKSTNPSSKNYSLCVDMYFSDLNSGTNSNNKYRKVFCRYNSAASTDTDKGLQWSILMALKPDTNDLVVQMRSADTDSVVLTNIIPKTPIRIGLVVSDKYFEVYRDGKLVKTVVINTPPLEWTGNLWGEPGGEPTLSLSKVAVNPSNDPTTFNQNPISAANPVCPGAVAGPLGYVYNLRIWRREISPGEMRDAVPRLLNPSEFDDMLRLQQTNEFRVGIVANRIFNRLKQSSIQLGASTSTLLDTVGTRVGGAANALAGNTENP